MEHDEPGDLRRILADRDATISALNAKLKLMEAHRQSCSVCKNCKAAPTDEPPDTVPGIVPKGI